MANDTKQYYLQNINAGYVGNSPLWWSNNGYTIEIENAKLFTAEEADGIIKSTKGSHTWKKWQKEKVLNAVIKVVDIDILHNTTTQKHYSEC